MADLQTIDVVSPEGEIGSLPANAVREAVQKYGYRLPTRGEVQHEALRKEYGEGHWNEFAAALEGAASGATFGISRALENATQITSPEAQAARQQFNPVASTVGEYTGMILPSLIAPEAAPVSLVTKGAARFGAGAAERVIANEVGQKVVGSTLEGLLAGGAFGVGQSINEGALGDPTLNAQKVFHNIGIGALLGGGVGAMTGTLGIAAKGILSKYGRQAETLGENVPRAALETEPIEAQGTIKPTGPIKMEGTIDFGQPDEKILERAQPLNPKNPLNQHDLNWLKNPVNSEPDAAGKPQVFSKIGTPEIPTMDPMAEGQTYMGDSVAEGMQKVMAERTRLNAAADEALENTAMPNGQPLSMTRNQYLKVFDDQIDAIKGTSTYGKPPGQKAVRALEGWIEAGQHMPDKIPATEIRDTLQDIRNEVFSHIKGGGVKGDAVSQALYEAQDTLDQYLKDNSAPYKKLQEEFAPFTRKSIELEDHLGWNYQKGTSDFESDWVKNRIAKPFQSALPSTKEHADLIRWFSKYAGVDFEKAAKANLINSKLNPEAYNAATWGAQVLEKGAGLLTHPQEIPGKLVSGMAKVALTGEMPEMIQQMRTKEIQSILLGKAQASSPGIVRSLANKIAGLAEKGSDLFQEGSFGNLMVPLAVKTKFLLDQHENLPDADRHVETLIALERARNDADRQINRSINGIFNKEAEPQEANEKLDKFLERSPQDHGKELEKLSNEVNDLQNNPQVLIDRLSQSIAGLGEYAPMHAQALNMTATRALQFLGQKLPRIPDKQPLDPNYVPSKDQILGLARTVKAVNRPLDVLNQIRHGNVSREAKEALQAVHPELYDHLKGKIIGAMADRQAKGQMIPLSKQLNLSYFLGQPLTRGMMPQSIQRNQQAFALPTQVPSQQLPARASGAKHLTLSKRIQTPLQRVANR